MKILGITGALRRVSTNTGLLRAVGEVLPEGVTFEIATLHGIPLYDGDAEAAAGKPAAVIALGEKIVASDGILIATPEYNFSIPGVLKNATDWLSRGAAPFKWKRTAIMGAGEGLLGTARSQYHLRQNLQALQAIVMPKPEMFVMNNEKKFNAAGDLTDDRTRTQLKAFVASFIDWVEKKP